ncbi:LysR family transcriptional regulator [Streptomonospora nanhaiensis]|uniref:LysR family transcriptional regulator n=1 Tax=Streptomonospora nanhaiensis TaxID=1323731 RepID=UPI001C386505|nr:LysR substrate-binding domain-containing protein [Streptomonospora nanhaiensis]MBV2366415.1 LysR family transcriptional regulator [Streptomonospora nanhaiensis]MBX9389958.1 LysR family transcriptional regulator [Streptomonospora nanhaiensis]
MDAADTRELRYFVAVAEELHFGRAAERLGIAQPPLSRAIQRLERRMGGPLLERGGNRRVELTEAGRVLLHEARAALEAVAAATRRTRRAARPGARLVLAVKPGGDGGLLGAVLAAYEAEPHALPVEISAALPGELPARVRDGRADLALVHLTTGDPGDLESEELLVEPQVAMLPRGHRLAGRARLRLADLAGDPLPRWTPEPGGAPGGAPVTDIGHLMHLVSVGRMVAVAPESVRAHAWGGVVCVPVADAAPTTLGLVWPAGSRSRAVAALVGCAVRVAGRHPHAAHPRAGAPPTA